MKAARLTSIKRLSWLAMVATMLLPLPILSGENSLSDAQVIVEQRFLDSWGAYAEQVNACRENIEPLQPELFEGVDATPLELLTALTYFHNKTQNACYEEEAQDFLVALHLMQESGLAEKVDRALDGDASLASDHLTFWWHEVRAEARYLALPTDLRAQLDSIERLHSPFDMRGTIRALDLMPD